MCIRDRTAQIGAELPLPVVVLVLSEAGQPLAGKSVTFQVTKSDGRLAAAPGGAGAQKLQVKADGAGLARAWWRLGSDAGCGNNRVQVTSKDLSGSVFFCASATAAPAAQIAVGGGDHQQGEVGAPWPSRCRVRSA